MSSDPFIPQGDRPDVDISELLEIHARTVNGRMSVGMVAQVQTWDRATQTCSVQPVTHARFQNGDTAQLPVIPRVPIRYPQGARFVITWPLQRGDFVWLDFGERSLEEWKASGDADYAPRNKRRFDMSDAVAYAGIASPADPIEDTVIKSDAMVLGHRDGCRIEIYETETLLGVGATEYVALANLVKSELDLLWKALESHTHTVPITGAAGTTPSTPPVAVVAPTFALKGAGTQNSTAGSVAATKTKAE